MLIGLFVSSTSAGCEYLSVQAKMNIYEALVEKTSNARFGDTFESFRDDNTTF
jgi:hypothetical protein